MILADALALSSENGLVNRETVALDSNDAAISGNAISNRNSNDISGDQVVGFDTRNMTLIANDAGLVG